MSVLGDVITLFCSLLILLSFILFMVVSGQMTSTDDVLKSMHLEVDENCIKDKIGYAKIKYHFNNCINDVQWQLREKIIRGESIQEIYDTFCDKKGDPFCSDVVLTKLQQCLTDAQKEFVKYQKNAEDDIRKYACENHASKMKNFYQVDFTSCSNDALKNQAAKCIELMNSLSTVKMEDFFTEEFCQKRNNLGQCWADAFKSCEDDTAFLFTSESEFIALNSTPCLQYLSNDSFTSSISTTTETTTQINKGTTYSLNLNLVSVMVYLVCLKFFHY